MGWMRSAEVMPANWLMRMTPQAMAAASSSAERRIYTTSEAISRQRRASLRAWRMIRQVGGIRTTFSTLCHSRSKPWLTTMALARSAPHSSTPTGAQKATNAHCASSMAAVARRNAHPRRPNTKRACSATTRIAQRNAAPL